MLQLQKQEVTAWYSSRACVTRSWIGIHSGWRPFAHRRRVQKRWWLIGVKSKSEWVRPVEWWMPRNPSGTQWPRQPQNSPDFIYTLAVPLGNLHTWNKIHQKITQISQESHGFLFIMIGCLWWLMDVHRFRNPHLSSSCHSQLGSNGRSDPRLALEKTSVLSSCCASCSPSRIVTRLVPPEKDFLFGVQAENPGNQTWSINHCLDRKVPFRWSPIQPLACREGDKNSRSESSTVS